MFMISQLNEVIFYVILYGMAPEGAEECADRRSEKTETRLHCCLNKRGTSGLLPCMNFRSHRTS